jgi:hypothetical protein
MIPHRGGLPHSDTSGSTPARGSPKIFAACHVLHRLLAPRHPPDALLLLKTPEQWPVISGQWPGDHPPFRKPRTGPIQQLSVIRRQTPENAKHPTPPDDPITHTLPHPNDTRKAGPSPAAEPGSLQAPTPTSELLRTPKETQQNLIHNHQRTSQWPMARGQ